MTATRRPVLRTDAEIARLLAPLQHPDRVSEGEWQTIVTTLLDWYGWTWNHNRRAVVKGRWVTNTSSKGYPDLHAVRPPWCIFLELKAVRHDVKPGQRKWVRLLQRCGGNVAAFFATPRDAAHVVALISDPDAYFATRHPSRCPGCGIPGGSHTLACPVATNPDQG